MIIGSATLNRLPDRAKRPKYSTNKAFDKSGVYSKSPKVADAMTEAEFYPSILAALIAKREFWLRENLIYISELLLIKSYRTERAITRYFLYIIMK